MFTLMVVVSTIARVVVIAVMRSARPSRQAPGTAVELEVSNEHSYKPTAAGNGGDTCMGFGVWLRFWLGQSFPKCWGH